MSQTLQQIFTGNPITTNLSTDLMYFSRSPYTAGNDTGMTYANFAAQFGAPYTAAALSATPDTNVTITLGGTPTTALLQATSITLGWSGQLSLTRGGTNASLTASNGGIFYSTASGGAILSGTATASQVLLSGASGAPSWSTATYPTTTTINQLLYSSSANTITGLATINNGVMTTSATGVPTWLINSATPGFVLTANSGAPPTWQAITAEGAITTINGDAGSVTATAGAVTLSGGTTGLTTSGATSTMNITGVLNLAHGGMNANLTASNGGIFYSTATAGAILAGTATANQVLMSGASTTPAWSTATYPATTTINRILFSTAANVVGQLATVNSAALVTTAAGVPVFSSTMTNGQVIIGSTGATPTAATLSAGTGVTITNGAGTITINATGTGTWINQNTSSVTMAANTGYTINNGASLVTLTLPTTANQGDFIEINGSSAGGWAIAQAAGQQIFFGNQSTTSGVGGSLASTNLHDCIRLRSTATSGSTTWTIVFSVGNITVV